MYKATLAAAVLLLAACSENNPNKAVFEKAINRYAAEQGVCVPMPFNIESGAAGRVLAGEETVRIAERGADGAKTNAQALKQMRVLEKEGFYKQAQSETVPLPDGSRSGKVQVYELTEKGRAQSRPAPGGPRLCIGGLKVEKVNWFTEPTPADGVTVSKVSYEARLETAKWAEQFIREGGSGRQPPDTARTLTATMVKTNDGWRDIREMR